MTLTIDIIINPSFNSNLIYYRTFKKLLQIKEYQKQYYNGNHDITHSTN